MSTVDKAGATASLVCAVHCVAMPIAFTLLPVLGLAWLDNPWVDRIFLVMAIVFALLAHPTGYLRHRRCTPVLMAASGIVGITLAVWLGEANKAHHYFIALGGLVVAGSHLLNRRFCHEHCCEEHDHGA